MDWTEIPATEADNKAGAPGGQDSRQRFVPWHRRQVRAFVEKGGGCRATFFNYRRRLEASG